MTDTAPGIPLYATFPRRLLALVIDAVVCVGFLMLAGTLGSMLPLGPTMRGALLVSSILFFLLYEPVLVAWTGRTIGHRVMNLKVVADTPSTRLPFWQAFLRFLMKGVTGIAAFITMPATRRSQALHDLPFGTTVQINDVSKASPIDYIEERPAPAGGPMPSALRRLAVIAAHAIMLFIVLSVAVVLVDSPECLETNRCTRAEDVVTTLLSTIWLAATVLVAVLGWQGRLWGCRRGPVPEPSPATL